MMVDVYGVSKFWPPCYVRLVQAAGVLMLVCALVGALKAQTPVKRTGDRWFHSGEWVLVGGVPPSMESQLLRPQLVTALAHRIYVFDYGDYAIKAFSWQGKLEWTAGNFGKGPLEFTNPTDLKVDSQGNLWVMDPSNARLTVLDSRGRLVRDLRPRADLPVTRILPLTQGGFWGTVADAQVFALRFDRTGRAVGQVPVPPQITSAAPAVRDAWLASVGPHRLLAAFTRADLLGTWNDSTMSFQLRSGPERVEFATVTRTERPGGVIVERIDRTAPRGSLAVVSLRDTSLVLFAGRSEFAQRIVDIYATDSLRYIGSYLLPEVVARLAVDDGHVVALIASPTPALRVWRWRPK